MDCIIIIIIIIIVMIIIIVFIPTHVKSACDMVISILRKIFIQLREDLTIFLTRFLKVNSLSS